MLILSVQEKGTKIVRAIFSRSGKILLARFAAVACGWFWWLPPGFGSSGGGSVPGSLAVA